MISGSIKDEKQRLRRLMLEKRRSLSKAEMVEKNNQITEHFCSWPLYNASQTVMFYISMPDEPKAELLIQDALGRGKRVCVPLLGDKYGEMTAAAITSLDDLVIGKMGLKMPKPDRAEILLPTAIDLVVVPGVAFDRDGNRLGMGAGYYDRFVLQSPKCILMGLSWTCQLVDRVPSEEHDICMHYLLTEAGLIACGS